MEYGFLVWLLALWAFRLDSRKLCGPAKARARIYEWCLGIVGVAGVLWLGHDLVAGRRLRSAALVYWAASCYVVVVFIRASVFQSGPTPRLLTNAVPDAIRILTRPTTWLCVVASMVMLAAAPRSLPIPTGGRSLARWYARQPRVQLPREWQIAPVILVEFIDYQCPICRQVALTYEQVIDGATNEYGGQFAFESIDFPLDHECNAPDPAVADGGPHPAACEAAAAVRLARRDSEAEAHRVIQWLWDHQSGLSREVIFDGVKNDFGFDVRRGYADVLPDIRAEAAAGRRLHVAGTPTFLLNGVRLPLLSATAMREAIELEVHRVRADGS
jgi:hypothetical protein